uniref:Uncharacterized protein n=1 Tax=Chromera velia CCMP2878 TaxID=1169474 RepID=A0A0G4HXY2_9ALVE|eukprot:Cvel_33343.t1-p1 / transcript=Cvel_33343.t1 / gene=Cvel_33343 / organism=Chromera_velia_CCMP2878 / gene_product=hypothetical protein / transcript_product=hypothetical protein / location=Cvel_scaffold5390:2396-3313(-) / protein_length=306 / sequence_SO=supercontig / SO=protein_coding / is_pseudo=false
MQQSRLQAFGFTGKPPAKKQKTEGGEAPILGKENVSPCHDQDTDIIDVESEAPEQKQKQSSAASRKKAKELDNSAPNDWAVLRPTKDRRGHGAHCTLYEQFQCAGKLLEDKKKGVWSNGEGAKNWGKENLKGHRQSKLHRAAVAADKAKKGGSAATDALNLFTDCVSGETAELVCLLKAVWRLLSDGKIGREIPPAIHFAEGMGAKPVPDKYMNKDEAGGEMVKCLSDALFEHRAEKVRKSPVFGVGIDEGTDRTKEPHLSSVVRFIDGRWLVTIKWELAGVNGKNASAINRSLRASLARVLSRHA